MRSFLGVLVAFVVMAMLTFAISIAPWFVFGVDRVMEPGRFDTTALINVYSIAAGLLGAIVGGWLCGTISRSREAVIALALLGFIAGTANAFVHSRKPDPGARPPGVSVFEATDKRKEPAWYTLVFPCIGPFGILLGGRRAVRR